MISSCDLIRFVDSFSSQGGLDPDLVIEFVLDMESVRGVSVDIMPKAVTVDYCFGDCPITLLNFDATGGICIRPQLIRGAMDAIGVSNSIASDAIDFLLSFRDGSDCFGKVFIDPYRVFRNSEAFVEMLGTLSKWNDLGGSADDATD